MDLFKIGFITVSAIDLLDISVVTFIFYQLFRLLRGTRAAPMLAGMLVIIVVSIIAPLLRMSGLSWLVAKMQTVWLIALVVLFQPELRRILIRLGQSRFIRYLYRAGEYRIVDEVVEAARMLSERGYGALIVLVRDVGLKAIIETGVKLEAEVSSALLTSIFTARSPLHDGAAVIQGGVIAAARCLLPLSENPSIDPSLGTRHRAAIGLSEESDAVVVVISEETRAISYAVGGMLWQRLEPDQLREELMRLLGGR
ncbi:MAG TPA: TIGR00159 family protein [Candidatus Latescibacteria bacterium]|nr:TIGR00159 family protein [Candidatus Latescibacterota bacterium]